MVAQFRCTPGASVLILLVLTALLSLACEEGATPEGRGSTVRASPPLSVTIPKTTLASLDETRAAVDYPLARTHRSLPFQMKEKERKRLLPFVPCRCNPAS